MDSMCHRTSSAVRAGHIMTVGAVREVPTQYHAASTLAYNLLHKESLCFGDQALLCPRRNLRPCAAG